MAKTDDLTQKVYRAFNPAPLSAKDKELYVDLNAVRGSSDFVTKLVNGIKLSDNKTCQIVTGHRGSGKTTELRRLQNELEKENFFVVFCEAENEIDPEDVDFPDLLICILHNMAEQLHKKAGIDLQPGYFKDRWERLREFLGSEVEFENLSLSAGMYEIGLKLRGSPKVRQSIRQALEPDTSGWLYAANDVIGKAKLELKRKRKGYNDLVTIVDGLDKIVLKPHPEAKCTMGEYLFVNREAQMSGFECHMVYTIPLAQAYSGKERVISNLYGINSIPVVPMTKIKTDTGDEYQPGIIKFLEVAEKRLKKAGTNIDEVFDKKETLMELIRLSGGQPREFMVLIRDAITSSGLPVTSQSIQRSVRDVKNAYKRQLNLEQLDIVKCVRKEKFFTRTDDNEKNWLDLLDSRAVLQYINDKEWYDVNPLVPE